MVYICPFGYEEDGSCKYFVDPNCPIDPTTNKCVDCISYNENYTCVKYATDEDEDDEDERDRRDKPDREDDPDKDNQSTGGGSNNGYVDDTHKPSPQSTVFYSEENSKDKDDKGDKSDTLMVIMIVLLVVLVPLIVILGFVIHTFRKNKKGAIETSMMRRASTRRISKEMDNKKKGKHIKVA